MATRQTYQRTPRRHAYSSSERGRYVVNSRNPYVEGTAARQLQEAPEWERRPEPQRRRRPVPQQRPVHLPSIGAVSFVFLMGAVVITLAVSFLYLKNQADVTRMQKEVVTMQKEIQQTREENQEAYQKIEASVDLSEVYDIATGKLGMVQAVNNQLYTYKNKKSDMVKQYADIPEAD